MAGPVVEMSMGIHQVCITKNATDTIVITVRTTANSLPIIYSPRCAALNSNGPSGSCTPPSARGVQLCETLASISVWRCGEHKIRRGGAAPNRNILGFCAVLLLPGSHRVLPRREPSDVESTVGASDCVVRSLQHDKVPVHPRMDVALYRNEFRLVPLGVDRR